MKVTPERIAANAKEMHAAARAALSTYDDDLPDWAGLPEADRDFWRKKSAEDLRRRRDVADDHAEEAYLAYLRHRPRILGSTAPAPRSWEELEEDDRETWRDTERAKLALTYGRWPYINGVPARLDPPESGEDANVALLSGTLSVYRCPACGARLAAKGICLNACHLGSRGVERFARHIEAAVRPYYPKGE